MAPTTVRFDPHHPIGAATFCDADGDCQQAEWGEVRLVSSDQGTGVTGGWAIGLTGGGARQGTFEAEWLAIQAFCG